MDLQTVIRTMILPALALLPANMHSVKAIAILLAIGLQESRFKHRRQLGNGPARGFWQFERGTQQSRGGVWGVFLHEASSKHLRALCAARGVEFHPSAIYAALEFDDVLAAGVARLLLWTDPKPLPDLCDQQAAWHLYARRTWRPGKPHPETWPGFHAEAVQAATVAA